MSRRLLRVLSIFLTVVMVMASAVGADELVEEVFVEESYSAEEADNAEGGDITQVDIFGAEETPQLEENETVFEESNATEDVAFVEEDYSSEDELSFSEEEASSVEEQPGEVVEENIDEVNAAEEETYAESSPDELIESSMSSVDELPAFADPAEKSTGSLRISMDLKSKDEGEMCVQGEPHLFIYLKQTMTSDGKAPATPQRYTIRLRNLSKGSGEFWTVSNRIGGPVTGTYEVHYYTPFAGEEEDCDRKVPSFVESEPDDSLMYEIKPGEKFAGATMTLSSDAVKSLVISKTDDTRMDLDATATTRASLIPGAYKKITGIESAEDELTFELYSSNSDGDEGELLATVDTKGAEITEELGRGFYFDPVLIPSPGDYWFVIKEDNSGADHFVPVTDSVYCHATVGYSDAGILDITSLEYLQGSVKDTSTNRKLTVSSSLDELTVKGDNKDVTGEAVYELYGPFEGHTPKRDDHGSFGKPIQTKKGSKYTFSNLELFDEWYTYVIVEQASKEGAENRDHLVMITARWTSDGAQWYIKDFASFTNKYTVVPVQQTFTIENQIKGKPTTAQSFAYRLRRVSDSQIATVRIEGNATKTKDVKLPSFTKAGTYEFRITEVDGTAAGFSYNTEDRTYKLKYVVKDNGKGKLNVTTYVDGEKVKDEKPVLTFKNKYAVKVKVQHVDASTSKGVSGGKSRIVDKDGTEVKKTWKSDGTAKEVSVTADGTYTIKEVKAPTGYQIADDVKFTIKDGKVSTGTTIRIPHTKITGSFTFNKVSSTDTKKAVSNVEFYLYRIPYEKGTKNYNSAAANLKKGTVKWSQLKAWKRSISQEDGAVTFTTLEPDTYYVIKENAITGQPYQLTPESKSAVISTKYSSKSKSVTTKVISGNNVLVSNSGSLIWKDTPTKVTVYMRSSSGALLKGAKLALTNAAGTTIDSWESGDSGHTITEKLNLNEAYKVTQTNQLQGYATAPAVTFTVKQENGNDQKVTLTAQKTATSTSTTSNSGGGSSGGGGSSSSKSTSSASTTRAAAQYVNVRVRENWTNPDGTVTAWPEGTTVRVQLYANNQEVSGRVLSLNAQNPSGAFENLPKNDTSGRAITYTAKAVSVTGYTGEGEMPQGTLQVDIVDVASTSSSGGAAVGTMNGTTGGTTRTTSAVTGDTSPILPLIALMALAAAVIAIVVLGRKKNRR